MRGAPHVPFSVGGEVYLDYEAFFVQPAGDDLVGEDGELAAVLLDPSPDLVPDGVHIVVFVLDGDSTEVGVMEETVFDRCKVVQDFLFGLCDGHFLSLPMSFFVPILYSISAEKSSNIYTRFPKLC